MAFQEMDFEQEFDGVWACASLVHVPKDEMDAVIARLSKALKDNGIMYASFKHGNKQEFRKGRLFNDYDEETLHSLINRDGALRVLKYWKTEDVRENRRREYWQNILVQKT